MGDTADNTPSGHVADSIHADMQGLLDHLKTAKAQAEEHLKAVASARQMAVDQLNATEIARKKADDDATYAYQAKVNTEEHAKSTAVFKGQAEADASSISTNKRSTDEAIAAITRAKVDAESDGKAIADDRKDVDQASQEITKAAQTGVSLLQDIEKARTAAEESSKTAAEALRSATDACTKSETAHAAVAQFESDAKANLSRISQCATDSTRIAGEIELLLTEATNNNKELKEVLEHLVKSDEIASKHEVRVGKLTEDLDSLIKKAESLLPGFTSAGLASAFCAQRERFAAPQRRWLRTFMVCMGVLVLVSLPSFLAAVFPGICTAITGTSDVQTWSETLHGFVMRLPILVPLVWLAIYAGRNYMLSLRLEEDYAYKQAISTAFEGYKREMKDIAAGDAENPTPITKLCVNILTALADRPGRIYDRHNKDITPANEVLEIVKRANELGQRQVRDN